MCLPGIASTLKNQSIQNNKYPVIDNITVDIESLLSLAHTCDPGLCVQDKSCCSCFHVCVEMNELEKITGFMPMASAYATDLKSDGVIMNVFDEEGPDLFSIDTDEYGLCDFAYHGGKNETLCSLHSVALQMDYQPEDVKPRDCVLWPLALTEDKPFSLSIDDEALSFPCNSMRSANASFLDPGIADIIRKLFGELFLREVNKCLK